MKKYQSIFEKYNFFSKEYGITDLHILNEAVLSPIYYKEVELYFKIIYQKIKKLKFKKLSVLCFWLNIRFRKYSIKFIPDKDSKINKNYDKEYQAGITKSGCLSDRKGTIKIYCNENLLNILNNEKYYNFFILNVIRIVGHELIHRNQMFHLENKKLRNYIFDHSKLETIKYLKNKQEVMCRAWQIIEEYRYNGLKDKQIFSLISKKKNSLIVAKSPTLMIYLDFFEKKDETLKLLYKYVYQYLTNQDVK